MRRISRFLIDLGAWAISLNNQHGEKLLTFLSCLVRLFILIVQSLAIKLLLTLPGGVEGVTRAMIGNIPYTVPYKEIKYKREYATPFLASFNNKLHHVIQQ